MTSEVEPPSFHGLEVAMAVIAGFAGIYVKGRVNSLSWVSILTALANSIVAGCIGLFVTYLFEADGRLTMFASMVAGYVGTDAVALLAIRIAIKNNWFGMAYYLDPILVRKLGVKPEELNPIPPVVKPPVDEA